MSTRCAIAVVAAALLGAAPAGAQAPWTTLKVCADPNNLPFSNREQQGFENKLAQIWARELGVEVEYTWFPHRRGFERNTLQAEDPERGGYKCDVIVGVPDGYDLAMTTRPYYRSTYALVYVAGRELDIRAAEDLHRSAARRSRCAAYRSVHAEPRRPSGSLATACMSRWWRTPH